MSEETKSDIESLVKKADILWQELLGDSKGQPFAIRLAVARDFNKFIQMKNNLGIEEGKGLDELLREPEPDAIEREVQKRIREAELQVNGSDEGSELEDIT